MPHINIMKIYNNNNFAVCLPNSVSHSTIFVCRRLNELIRWARMSLCLHQQLFKLVLVREYRKFQIAQFTLNQNKSFEPKFVHLNPLKMHFRFVFFSLIVWINFYFGISHHAGASFQLNLMMMLALCVDVRWANALLTVR